MNEGIRIMMVSMIQIACMGMLFEYVIWLIECLLEFFSFFFNLEGFFLKDLPLEVFWSSIFFHIISHLRSRLDPSAGKYVLIGRLKIKKCHDPKLERFILVEMFLLKKVNHHLQEREREKISALRDIYTFTGNICKVHLLGYGEPWLLNTSLPLYQWTNISICIKNACTFLAVFMFLWSSALHSISFTF